MTHKIVLIWRLRFTLLIVFLSCVASTVDAQMQVERLDRGLVAVRKGQGYFISWRLMGDESYDLGFNIYRNTTKLNSEPIVNVTCYYDSVASLNSQYYIRPILEGKEIVDNKYAKLINENEGENSGYFDIPLVRPETGVNGGTYSPNDASTADLNGDGEYDIVLKWDPSNSKDNSQSGVTDDVFLDGYTLSGTHLWRINLGPNIRAGAHYTQFLVYDFDGDGKTEIMVKTAPGTQDASGNYISKGPAASADHSKIYRNASGYILTGPEYITVFDGATGLELETAEYWPLRGVVSKATWGDDYGNRVDRFNAAVAYVDGVRPTAVFQRGYYTRQTMAAWDWRDGKLIRRWTFDSNTSGNGNYYGQGNHSMVVIDADGDGKQDLVTGSAVIGSDGKGIHTTKKGHGDATHVTYMIKNSNRPLIFMPHENKVDGVTLRYADNGEMVFTHGSNTDVGRGAAAELDPNKPGFMFWAASGLGLYDITGAKVGSIPNSINFVIWWDGNLSRDLMNGSTIDQWHITSNSATRLLAGSNVTSVNGTKSTPNLQADLFGDWREEVILSRNDNAALRVFTTTMPTKYKLYTFMHDPVYRVAVSWQNSSYNQPPHPGFYVASDMDFPVAKPNVTMLDGVNRGAGTIIKNLMLNDVSDATKWSINSNFKKSIPAYSDLSLNITELPDYLEGKEWVKVSSESRKWNQKSSIGSLEVKQDAIISVLYTNRVAETPAWLSSFEKRNETVKLSSPIAVPQTMTIYEKQVKVGEKITLGINSEDGNPDYPMFFIVARSLDGTSSKDFSELKRFFKVFPNPAKNEASIEFYLESDQLVKIDLFDQYGHLVRSLVNDIKASGLNSLNMETSNLAAGIYFVRLMSADQIIQQKIVVTR